MKENYFRLSRDVQREILVGSESILNITSNIIEKDIWICWILDKLFKLPFKMAFKGGTSLSKGYDLIDRFSEDVDITIDYQQLLPDIDLSKKISKSQHNKIRKQLKLELKKYSIEIILPSIKESFALEFETENFEYQLSEDGEKFYFHYPTHFDKNQDYLRSNVLIELGGCNSTTPSEHLQINTILSNINSDLILPTPKVNVLSPLRTFWEKATLIHVECHRKRLKESPDRLSRHWYDLFKLSNSWVGQEALDRREILTDVLKFKKAFFNGTHYHYEKCENSQFLLIPDKSELVILKTDYTKMIDSGMFSKDIPSFDAIIANLKILEGNINNN